MTASDGRSFPDGTIIIVEPEKAAKAGDYVVAKDVVTQRATFKKLATDGARWYLRALNRDYPVIEIDDPAQRVIGVVVEYWTGGKL
jgi:SOS-response transcriptional repressor LexA